MQQRSGERDHVNAAISGDFPKIAQDTTKLTKKDQNGPQRSISGNSRFDGGISPAIGRMAWKRKHFEILTPKDLLDVYFHRVLKFGLTPWFVKPWLAGAQFRI